MPNSTVDHRALAETRRQVRVERETARAEQDEALTQHLQQDARSSAEQHLADQRVQRVDRTYAKLARQHGVLVYRELANRNLGRRHVHFRVLCALLQDADGDLSNCFSSRRRVLKNLGRCIKINRLDQVLRDLTKWGWIRRHQLTEGDVVAPPDEALEVANQSGRFISAKGTQFLLPAGLLGPNEPAWEGPTRWNKRWWGQRRKRGRDRL